MTHISPYVLLRSVAAISAFALLQACIKPEPPNPEADIETFTVPDSLLTGDIFIDQSNRKILLYLEPEAFESGIAPRITLSAGATVSPASGDSIHFTKEVVYTVSSASGENRKQYTVEVVSIGEWKWSFEKWLVQDVDNYQYPVESEGEQVWSSGNPGVALSGVPKQPSGYPLRSTDDSKDGTHAAELVTLKGTTLSGIVGIKLFAGSLFLGNFDINSAFLEPLKATQFGQPFAGKATRFTGHYKYTPGATYQDKAGNPVPGYTDSCAIYAVLYTGRTRLDATNIHTSDRIVAVAQLPDGSGRGNWTHFNIPFNYIPGRKSERDMMMAIVASSSKDGDQYRGAIGSRLVIDSLAIIQ
ncbi:PCMD domain-containing protein [Chitinophaga rhizosphaerae]|uniref:PCMD domain-containing protein n=1 Tax=Chitinophaga rhizosphaerae TaxID=1864947 RepID=UPI000F80D9BA|nr:PCMD domain-containing protein [Chitinophaga rhizosphaerae]